MKRDSLSGVITPRSLVNDKGLARLGDSITNLVLSLAISFVLRRPEGMRASDKVLSLALTEAGFRKIAPKRAGSDQMGDIVESIIASAWLNKIIDIEDAASVVASEFKEDDLRDRKKEEVSAIRGFANLLKRIMQNLDLRSVDGDQQKTHNSCPGIGSM
ncbi:MAG: ribonuclease III family protein [Promethearchaeati archaeon SRVP18_Atabeyarchaeia-1]